MARHKLSVERRTITGTGKLNALRAQKIVPGVIYGSGIENVNIQIAAPALRVLLSESASEHILVDLQFGNESRLALLQDIQHNFLNDTVMHVDFLAVNDNTEITSLVPLALTGEAAGSAQGGVVDQNVYELHIKCQVKDLPEEITVDISSLQLGDTLRAGDLKLPAGVTTTLHPDDNIVTLVSPKEEEETEEAAAEDAAAPAPEK
ncbi:MAG: 50S ribosomal protein L25 [Akkermansia sp.]|nr:50S ribosomal protein L25 [Akkermansia sp.]